MPKNKFIDDEVVEEDDDGRIHKGGNDSGEASEDDDAYESSFVDDEDEEEEEEEDESEEEREKRALRRLKESDPKKYRKRMKLEKKLRRVQELEEKLMLRLDHLEDNEEEQGAGNDEEETEEEEEVGDACKEKEQPKPEARIGHKRKLIDSDDEEEEEGVKEKDDAGKDAERVEPVKDATPPVVETAKKKAAPEHPAGQTQRKYDPPAARKSKGLTLKGVFPNKHARETYPKNGAAAGGSKSTIARSPLSAAGSSRVPESPPPSSATSSSAATIPGPNGFFRRPMLVTRTSEVHYDEPGPVRATPDAASLSSAAATGARRSWGKVLVGADKPHQKQTKDSPPAGVRGGQGGQGQGASGAKKPPVPQFQATFLDREGTLCTKDADGHVQMFSSNV